nr:MAG TPA: hypothetical protein [Caudoviricetes sp.]
MQLPHGGGARVATLPEHKRHSSIGSKSTT